jgi:hypothetical protein
VDDMEQRNGHWAMIWRTYPQIAQITENLWVIALSQLCEFHLVCLQGWCSHAGGQTLCTEATAARRLKVPKDLDSPPLLDDSLVAA